MRIIAGEFRGRRLLDPADRATRPITDRVKQSIFDILAPRLPEVHVYDVFAGTGSFGLESISRAAAGCVFFERHRPAVERLRRNIALLGVEDRTQIVAADIFSLGERQFASLPSAGVIFFDPPYPFIAERPQDVQQALVAFSQRLSEDGLIVFRHEKGAEIDLPLPVQDTRVWGSMQVEFLARPQP